MQKTKIFISSTIYDFKYLRSALEYHLEKLGFSVQLSERPNFDTNTDEATYKICLDNISTCQYFVLLIGCRVGGYYNEKNNISITRAEYERAYQLHLEKKIKLICFVEREILILKEAYKEHPVSEGDKHKRISGNPQVLFDFIDLVRRSKEMKIASITSKI